MGGHPHMMQHHQQQAVHAAVALQQQQQQQQPPPSLVSRQINDHLTSTTSHSSSSPNPFSTSVDYRLQGLAQQQQQQQQQQQPQAGGVPGGPNPQQRVFTGTVTKLHENFG